MLLSNSTIIRNGIAGWHKAGHRINVIPTRTHRIRARFQSNDTKTYQDKVIEDHNKIRRIVANFHKHCDPHTRQNLVYLLIHELSMHGSKEEQVIYPVAREVLGGETVDHMLSAHHDMESNLEKLGSMNPEKDMKAYEEQFEAVVASFRQHSRDEERHDFPQLTKLIGPKRAVELGEKWEEASVRVANTPLSWVKNKLQGVDLHQIEEEMTGMDK